ncbi:MAG TPA: zinc ABC transporter permease [Rhodospirillaceae bacterium]|nr:zinc ABC transporter permease [Rhodospirillaceae bacterium]
MPLEEFLQIDLPAILVAVLASAICAILGSFLLLRRQALMGDTLSHVVLPGIAVGFLLFGGINPLYMMGGALAACLVSVLLINFIKTYGKIEPGAAMGIVFTAMFALGIVLLETKIGSKVHLDAQHALYGALELTYWPDPGNFSTIPHQIVMLAALLVLVIVAVAAFFKEFKITSFDPVMAATMGYKVSRYDSLLMVLVALAAVAAFEAAGSIIVIAMFICPAATARMFCDDLAAQLKLAAIIGSICGFLGYALAAIVPLWIGFEHSLSASGVIAVTAGALQVAAMLFAPKYGALRS